ncbi:MAG: hypothetical protein AAF221_08405 [Pseudomonadota bacterium]
MKIFESQIAGWVVAGIAGMATLLWNLSFDATADQQKAMHNTQVEILIRLGKVQTEIQNLKEEVGVISRLERLENALLAGE